MTASRKKCIVRRLSGETLPGYLPASGMVRDNSLELLDLAGRTILVLLDSVKMVSFVREFNLTDSVNPERILRWRFPARPRSEGLWVRLTLRSQEVIEGLAAADLNLLDAIRDDLGLHLTPPDTRSNTQHLFIPRSAIAGLEILAVITSPTQARRRNAQVELQEDLFARMLPVDGRPN